MTRGMNYAGLRTVQTSLAVFAPYRRVIHRASLKACSECAESEVPGVVWHPSLHIALALLRSRQERNESGETPPVPPAPFDELRTGMGCAPTNPVPFVDQGVTFLTHYTKSAVALRR